MAMVQTEQRLFPHIYGGMACNSLMADSWSDRTPLHEAAFLGRLLHLRDLIAQGFQVDTLTMDRVSPLHEACLGHHYACAKFLVDKGANVDIVSTDGATPLFNACISGDAACVKLLLQHSASVHTTFHHLASPIHEAAKNGHKDCLELLLSYGAHIDLELPVLGTPLYSACMSGATDCVRILLLSADVQIGCKRDSPLHAAVLRGAPDVVDLLLDYGADMSWRNAGGKTALDIAEPNSAARTRLQTKGPCSLTQLCRLSVRRSLGRNRLHTASTLFIPHSIKAYLLYH